MVGAKGLQALALGGNQKNLEDDGMKVICSATECRCNKECECQHDEIMMVHSRDKSAMCCACYEKRETKTYLHENSDFM